MNFLPISLSERCTRCEGCRGLSVLFRSGESWDIDCYDSYKPSRDTNTATCSKGEWQVNGRNAEPCSK